MLIIGWWLGVYLLTGTWFLLFALFAFLPFVEVTVRQMEPQVISGSRTTFPLTFHAHTSPGLNSPFVASFLHIHCPTCTPSPFLARLSPQLSRQAEKEKKTQAGRQGQAGLDSIF